MKSIENIKKFIKENNIWSFKIVKTENLNLLLIGGNTLDGYHELEMYFKGVEYLACLTVFNADNLREATEDEKILIGKNYVNISCPIFLCFEKFDAKYFIVADALEYKTGVVYHYQRESLEEGERIAEWDIDG